MTSVQSATATIVLRRLGGARRGLARVPGGMWVAIVLLVVIFAGVALAEVLAPYPPNAVDLRATLAPPSPAHWLGTDASGRDILSRLLYGGRISLLAPTIIVIVATLSGTTIGLVAGWVGGVVEQVLRWATSVAFAFPSILLGILLVATYGASPVIAAVALVLSTTPFVARLVHAITTQEKSKTYAQAYRVLGFSGATIAVRHILPNIAPIILSQAVMSFGFTMIAFGSLSFLGFGVQPPTADWGLMVAEGQQLLLRGAYVPALAPVVLIVVTVTCVTVIGENLSDRFARRSA